MEQQSILSFNLKAMVPEFIVLSVAVLLILIHICLKDRVSLRCFGTLGLLGVVAAGIYTLIVLDGYTYQILSDTFRMDSFTFIFKTLILLGASLVLMMSLAYKDSDNYSYEYYYLLLFALLGAMIMVSSIDLITLFVALELLSITSYILVALRRSTGNLTILNFWVTEASWKYIVMGGVASAFILYGTSFLYGLAGSTNLFIIQERLQGAINEGYSSIIVISLALVLFGLGLKMSLAPFHMWTPDIYQSASAPLVTFLAVVSKIASVALLLRIVIIVYYPLLNGPNHYFIPYSFVALAVLSMLVGNLMALRQMDLKRLFAYSSIAQAGYLIVPLATLGMFVFPSIVYYLLAYLLMMVGVFTIIHILTDRDKASSLSVFAGLSQRSPMLALSMTIFILSLAGLPTLPITAGFFGKFYLLLNTFPRHIFLAIIVVIATVISYYYYFNLIRLIYFTPSENTSKIKVPAILSVVIFVALLGTIGMGCCFDTIVGKLSAVDWITGFSKVENVLKQ